MKSTFVSTILVLLLLTSCSQKENCDLLVYNAKIYTVDSLFTIAEAIAVKDGKIISIGSNQDLRNKFTAAEEVNALGKFIYPGFIDAHAHFEGYAFSLQRVDVSNTKSWEEVIEKIRSFAEKNPEGWITGRGWDQNDWEVREFPTNEKLNELFPDRPLLITRIDGHAAIANQKALELAGIKPGDNIEGGEIEEMEGTLTGLLIDNAIRMVSAKIPGPTDEEFRKALLAAQENCFAMGLTTIDDCGLGYKSVDRIRKLHESGELKMRLYIMLADEKENYAYAEKNGMIKTDRLNVRSFKVYGDGALGSRGACLLEPYSDKPGSHGFLLSPISHFDSVAAWNYKNNFQMCTHAIGDSGNRTILNVYAKYLSGKNDRRWRIEHAQVVHPDDFPLFGSYSVIPSVQPTHATSDMYWAEKRIGAGRISGAYAYRQLMEQNNWLPLGTDFPVEDISPLKTFYAAVIRKDARDYPAGGFQPTNALTREQALKGMTVWAAKANFEEHEKGSLETGKFADFIILDNDLMTMDERNILGSKIITTFLGGERVYQSRN